MAGSSRDASFCHGPDNTLFKHQPLQEHEIRLVKFKWSATRDDIALTSEHRRMHSDGQYYALSYCWGIAAAQRQITLDGQPFNVTQNLFRALSTLLTQQPWGECYWIDAICINQHDINERNSQVQRMWRIFHAAIRVISWLGPSDSDTEALFKAWQETGDMAQVDQTLVKVGVKSIFSRQYFTRTWVIPEVMQARDIVLMCGSTYFPRHAMQTWRPAIEELEYRHLLARYVLRSTKSPEYGPQAWDRFDTIFGAHYAFSACVDERDRIFAMLSDPRAMALGSALWLTPDYSTSLEGLWLAVMRQFTELNLRHGWSGMASKVCSFGFILAMALGVSIRSEAFGARLAEQVGIIWRPPGSYNMLIVVAVLKAGGMIMLSSSDLHPVFLTTLARDNRTGGLSADTFLLPNESEHQIAQNDTD